MNMSEMHKNSLHHCYICLDHNQVGETKILELEEELRVVANNLKSLEVQYDEH